MQKDLDNALVRESHNPREHVTLGYASGSALTRLSSGDPAPRAAFAELPNLWSKSSLGTTGKKDRGDVLRRLTLEHLIKIDGGSRYHLVPL